MPEKPKSDGYGRNKAARQAARDGWPISKIQKKFSLPYGKAREFFNENKAKTEGESDTSKSE